MTEAVELEHLERTLWEEDTWFDAVHMDAVLAPGFFGSGRSGRRYTRAETMAFSRRPLDGQLRDVRVTSVARGVWLVTYVSEVGVLGGTELANRGSLWVRAASSWQLLFHQGTPCNDAREALVLHADLGEGISLRPIQDGDVDSLHEAIASNAGHLRPWVPFADQDFAGTAAFVAAAVVEAERREALNVAVIADGAPIGVCGFHEISWPHRSAAIGYWLIERRQGTGIMRRAVDRMLAYGFETLGLHRIEVRTASDNVRSRTLAERAGFTFEGVMRGAEQIAGRAADQAVYSMVAPEWGDDRRRGLLTRSPREANLGR